MIEKTSLDVIVIDTWFHDNGRLPELVTYEKWKAGWTSICYAIIKVLANQKILLYSRPLHLI